MSGWPLRGVVIRNLIIIINSTLFLIFIETFALCDDGAEVQKNKFVDFKEIASCKHKGSLNSNCFILLNPKHFFPGRTNFVGGAIAFKAVGFYTDEEDKFSFRIKLPVKWSVEKVVIINHQENDKEYELIENESRAASFTHYLKKKNKPLEEGYNWWLGLSEEPVVFKVNEQVGVAKISVNIYIRVPEDAILGDQHKISYNYTPHGQILRTQSNSIEAKANVVGNYYTK